MSAVPSVWLSRDCDACILGLDEDCSRCGLDCVLEICSEAMVPAAPQRRLVRHRLQTQPITEIGVLGEVFDEGSVVVPAMAFFQQEQAKQCLHLVARRACVSVVGIESDVCEWEIGNKRFDCLVFILVEPRFCDEADVGFQLGK